MKKNNILYSIVLLAFASISLASCDSYLDKMPDNRAEVDSEDKIASLTTSAYPDHDYILLNEYMSDNRNPDENFLRNKEILFKKTVDILFVNILESKEIERISKTTIEGLFFGIASNVEQLINIDNTTLQCYYDNLINDRLFSLDNLKD